MYTLPLKFPDLDLKTVPFTRHRSRANECSIGTATLPTSNTTKIPRSKRNKQKRTLLLFVRFLFCFCFRAVFFSSLRRHNQTQTFSRLIIPMGHDVFMCSCPPRRITNHIFQTGRPHPPAEKTESETPNDWPPWLPSKYSRSSLLLHCCRPRIKPPPYPRYTCYETQTTYQVFQSRVLTENHQKKKKNHCACTVVALALQQIKRPGSLSYYYGGAIVIRTTYC